MNQSRPLPGLASIGAGLAPMSDEEIALADLLTAARAVEHECDGPTVHARAKLMQWLADRPKVASGVLSAACNAAILEASRG